MFNINGEDSNIDDGVEASDSDVENTNPGTNDMADSETDGTDIMLGSRASSPDATDHKKHLLSLTQTYQAKDIKHIQKQPQNSPYTKGDIQIILKQMFQGARLDCSSHTNRGDPASHKASHGQKVQSLLPGHQSHSSLEMKTEKQKEGGPTSKNFHVQLKGPLACQWNCCAADIFSEAYIKKYKNQFKHEDLVACFKTHLCTLKNQHEHIKASPTKTQMDIECCLMSARQTHRQGIAWRRGEVLDGYGELQFIACHLSKLGVDGMSGDESVHSGGHWHYIVWKLNWRSDNITAVLRVLDALALISHWTSDGWPRPVHNFPHNFYQEDWLNTLDDYELQELNIHKPVNLTLPDWVLRPSKTPVAKGECSKLYSRFLWYKTQGTKPLRAEKHEAWMSTKGDAQEE
ncbi:hypothetical protein BJY52DRAFT_1227678 [Lactarius psammicola]|nr:hypothetical protein BJY52DRAFT_1227678 [Lactarius psammicola]